MTNLAAANKAVVVLYGDLLEELVDWAYRFIFVENDTVLQNDLPEHKKQYAPTFAQQDVLLTQLQYFRPQLVELINRVPSHEAVELPEGQWTQHNLEVLHNYFTGAYRNYKQQDQVS